MLESGNQIWGQADVGNANLSRFELAKNQIMESLAEISIDNGYRNDIADVIGDIRLPSEVAEYPEIGVLMGLRTVKGITSTKSLIDSDVDVYIQIVTKPEESVGKINTVLIDSCESIHHDLCRCLHGLFIENINSPEGWNVRDGSFSTEVYEMQACGVVLATFKIHLRNMDGAFL